MIIFYSFFGDWKIFRYTQRKIQNKILILKNFLDTFDAYDLTYNNILQPGSPPITVCSIRIENCQKKGYNQIFTVNIYYFVKCKTKGQLTEYIIILLLYFSTFQFLCKGACIQYFAKLYKYVNTVVQKSNLKFNIYKIIKILNIFKLSFSQWITKCKQKIFYILNQISLIENINCCR